MATAEGIKQLTFQSPELYLVKPGDFRAFYSLTSAIPGLKEEIERLGGAELVRGIGYGSFFSGDASKNSLTDILFIIRNPYAFYYHAAECEDIKLGTTRDAGLHAEFNYRKNNYYQAKIHLSGRRQGVKLWVLPLDELEKHAKGGRPGVSGSKGKLYTSGRLQKAAFPIIVDNATPEEQAKIDESFNQARIDGVWLSLGLLTHYFTFEELAGIYPRISYLADKRIEKASKAQSLLAKNYVDYEQMLNPILACFVEHGIIRPLPEEVGVFEKRMSLGEEEVRKWLTESAKHAFGINFCQNPLTFGLINSALYGVAKVKRAKGWNWIPLG